MANNRNKKRVLKKRNPYATILRNPEFSKARIVPKKEPYKPEKDEDWA